jgi:hypothetical protein
VVAGQSDGGKGDEEVWNLFITLVDHGFFVYFLTYTLLI